jgi:predicted nuclease of predicted toxin-antitoxin system
MRWIVDECVARHLAAQLRAAGHDVIYVADEHPSIGDRPILNIAQEENRLVLTEDTDFGELLFKDLIAGIPGIVLVRMRSRPKSLKWNRLESALAKFGDRLFGQYLVIEETRFRIRALPS